MPPSSSLKTAGEGDHGSGGSDGGAVPQQPRQEVSSSRETHLSARLLLQVPLQLAGGLGGASGEDG
eukprot:198202-Prymnesium_polylepis.1